MNYPGMVTIDRTNANGEFMNIGFVVNYAFDKKGKEIPLTDNSILEAIKTNSISSGFVEMRSLQPKKSEGTYLYNEETNIKDKKGNVKYRHVVEFSAKQLQTIYTKGKEAVLQNENKEGVKKVVLGCKCPVGQVPHSKDVEKLRQWRKDGKDPQKKPKIRTAGLYPRFSRYNEFKPSDVRVTEDTLEQLDKQEKRFWTNYKKRQYKKDLQKLENAFSSVEYPKEESFEYGK